MADVFSQTVDRTKPSKQAGGKAQSASSGGDVWSQTVARSAPGGDSQSQGMPLAPDAWGRMKQAYEGTLPLLDENQATLSGVGGIARSGVGAVKGIFDLLRQAGRAWNDPKAEVGDVALPQPQIGQIPGAIRDINAGPDPTGSYLKAAGDTAQQGAGQALTALATEGAGRVLPKVADIPAGRLTDAAGAGIKGAIRATPIVGPMARGAMRGALKSWRESAPADVEIPPSKVSTTPPESVSKSSQLQQSRALQNIPVQAVGDKSTILSQLQQIAQQPGTGVSAPAANGPPLRIAGEAVPADTNLAPALEKSLPQNRVQGKIMQALRKEGPGLTVGIDRLMESPQLKGISREQVIDAARSLRDQGKIWHEQTGGGAHPVSYTVALKKR